MLLIIMDTLYEEIIIEELVGNKMNSISIGDIHINKKTIDNYSDE